ncbi:MAG: LysM peptidoglycan-binding domain-containing protein [Muribaculaceae bacterium]|nr:LysM peptidoglycan-binding domain-containing protein [Muribaculaceae bacterium]
MKFKNIITLAFLSLAVSSLAQIQLNLPTTQIGDKEYYRYDSSNGESIYDIAAKLGVTKDYIIQNNPDAADGISNGMTLYFPTGKTVTPAQATLKPQYPVLMHEVKQGETLYGLAKSYGTTIDELIAVNPGSENGIKIGQKLMIPSSRTDERAAVDADKQVHDAFSQNSVQIAPLGSDPVYQIINDGEDIYTIAKHYNTSIESILINNPGLKPDEYVAGTKIKVVPNTAVPFNYERVGRRNYKYEVKRGETYASIATDNGISEAELKAANPDLKKVKKGKTIILPKPYTEQVTGDMATIPVEELRAYYQPRIQDLYENLVAKRLENEVNIALVLPFQLHKSAPPKQAYLYTDYYKGFLLAMDSVSRITNRHINIKVYDTQHNLNVTDSILALPELKSMNMIIAPSEPQQLVRINAFGKANGVPVMNCFTTKNEDYLDNPYVYQVNTPTNEIMHDVMKWFDEQFKGYNVVFLNASSESDKEMFERMRTHINRKKYPTATINVSGDLTYNDISNQMNPGSKYVFIPSSGDKALVKKYIKALKQVKNERFDCDLSLIAYPEYVLYLKDYQTDLQDVDTYMFTRFFNAKGFRTRDLEAAYKTNFGGEPLSAVPNMAIYGYDTGMYLLKSLGVDGIIDEETPLYKGIQTSFRWERGDNWRGYTNQAIEVVHFSTDHQITVHVK